MNCPTCKKEFNPHTGRRPKKFCSDNCKVKYFNARKVLKNIKEDLKQVDKLIEKYSNPNATVLADFLLPNIQKQIDDYTEELKHLGDGAIGKKRKRFVEDKIFNLKSQPNGKK